MKRAAFLASMGMGTAGFLRCTPPSPADVPAQWLDVRSYGAVGDGNADDHAPIQRALDAAAEAAAPVVVHAPAGVYAVSRTLHVRRHGTVLHFDGLLVPHGVFDDYLLLLDGRRRTSGRSTYAQGKLDVTRLRIDGRRQARGVRIEHVDHAYLADVLIERTAGTALRLAVVRESDFTNVTVIEGVGSEPSMVIDQDSGDGANNLRFYGLTLGYCTGPALLVDSHTRNPSRNLFFFGAQMHYLDHDRGWGPPSMDVRFIELRKARRVVFIASNLRLAESSQGVLLTLGSEAENADEIRLIGCTLSGEGRGAIGIDAVNCASLTMTACDTDMRNGRTMRGRPRDFAYYGGDGMALPELNAAPRSPLPGLIALADGQRWNPLARRTTGAYLVRYQQGRWLPFG